MMPFPVKYIPCAGLAMPAVISINIGVCGTELRQSVCTNAECPCFLISKTAHYNQILPVVCGIYVIRLDEKLDRDR